MCSRKCVLAISVMCACLSGALLLVLAVPASRDLVLGVVSSSEVNPAALVGGLRAGSLFLLVVGLYTAVLLLAAGVTVPQDHWSQLRFYQHLQEQTHHAPGNHVPSSV